MNSVVISRTPTRTRSALHALFALTLAWFALAASGPAWADPPGRVGRIAETDGNVWVFEDEQGEWVQAQRNRPVTEGDRLSAERGARAEIQIGSGTLRVDGSTDIEFPRLDDARVEVRVLGGTAALRVRASQSVREFALVTAEGRYEPLRPGHYRVDVEDRSSMGETLAGAMRFEAQDSVLEIGDGQRAEFWQEGGTTHYAWASRSDDRFGDWIVRQDREDSRELNRYVSPEMTGAEDLDRYGDWDRHPEYGAVWYPRTVVSGWAPYRYGHWAYVRPWGWTWVDDAPWGFAPFHYGRWVSYGGRWGWCPGQYVARPVYAPALVAWFGGPNVSVGIGVGGPAVGWVPLAPREIYYPGYYHTPRYVRIVNGTHARWHGPNPRYERPVPTGPIMYTNQGVAGGVTVVPQAVVQNRQPIGARVVVPVDARTVSSWQADGVRGRQAMPPAPPAARVVATPGGAVPAPPNATPRSANTWSRIAPRVTAGQGDGGRAPARGVAVAPPVRTPQQNAAPANGRVVTPAAPPQAQATPAQRDVMPQRPSRGERDERDERADSDRRNGRDERADSDRRNGRDARDEQRGDRRVGAPPSMAQPGQPVQPAQPPQPQAMPVPPRPQQPQRSVEPPAVVRPAQPAIVAPPPQVRPVPPPRVDDGNGQQRGRGVVERDRPEPPQQRHGGPQGADDDRTQRVREPRWNQAR